jgi:uncharacterized protein YbbK (DUF523 family)
MKQKIHVSSCFLGDNVRYNGKAKTLQHPYLTQWLKEGRLVKICPEMSGGLLVPRMPAEIQQHGLIMTQCGTDLTTAFEAGAQKALDLCIKHKLTFALLKESSPSCGSHLIYDGSFSQTKIPGQGVTAALLQKNNIRVFSENEIEQLAMLIN